MCRKGLFSELPLLSGHRQMDRVFRHTCFLRLVCCGTDTSCSGSDSLDIISKSHIFLPYLSLHQSSSRTAIISCQIGCRFCAETGEPPLPHRKPHLVIHYQSSQCSEVLWPSMQLFSGKSGKDKSAKDSEMGETLVKNWIFTPEIFRFIVCS